jgi:penicillin-binding protein 1A
VVLDKMREAGFITAHVCNDAQQKEVVLCAPDEHTIAPHAKEYIRQCLEAQVGKKALYTGGLTVQTTLNRRMQQRAEEQFVKKVTQLKKKIDPEVDGALITLQVRTGEIRALVGGYDFKASKFNRALQARRQLGSVFKSIVFAAAVEHGIRFNEVEIDEPIELPMGNGKIWRPRNYDRKFNGQITLAYALSRSNNIVPIKIFMRIGAPTVIECAQRCQLSGPFYPFPSLALGCVDTTLQEAAAMFNLFANNGRWVQTHCIRWIKDAWGNKIYKHEPKMVQALSSYVSGQVAKVLSLGLDRIRALLPQQWPDTQAISKTGTTNDARTCWFVGSTPEYTTAVYIGCDDNRSMGLNTYPLHTAFPIWVGLHRYLQYTQKQFVFDPSLKELTIDEKTGTITSVNKAGALTIYV